LAHPKPEIALPHAFRVRELLDALQDLLREQVGRVWVIGEISNFIQAASGHCYFTLKDASAQVRAVLFRGYAQHLRFELQNGIEVLVHADAAVYEARGDLQLLVRRIEPCGQGALQLAFEQLRARLEQEGLFAPERKRPLPPMPRCIGIVASKHSAALRDVLQVSGRRFPQAKVLITHTRVQGEGAEFEIREALELLGKQSEIELILLVRGGGSLEDLWAFNTEVVARAILACPVPVVTGVGHEIDFTISDLVADLRAPTPSAAAELALPSQIELSARLAREWNRLEVTMARICEGLSQRLDHRIDALHAHSPQARLRLQSAHFINLQQSLARGVAVEFQRVTHRLARLQHALDRQRPSSRLAAYRARLDVASRLHRLAVRRRLESLHARLGEAVARLEGLSPLAALGRGYAIVSREADGKILRSPECVSLGERLRIRFAQGGLSARVEKIERTPEPEA